MSARDREPPERFRIRPRPPRSRTGRSGHAFVTRVITEMSQVGRGLGRASGRGNHAMSRGQVAARFAGDRLKPQSRRVVVKTRLVVRASSSPRAVQTHLRYIARDGVTPDGAPGVAYDAQGDDADLNAFEQRGREDRHQFRFIIAPEDAAVLEDLHIFTRELMSRMEVDVGSRLDWVAVDHWDTDNPHTHVVLRGQHEAGHDLVLAREYISHGMRFRASELATQWLGPRTELEIRQSITREVAQERWSSLDQALKARAVDAVVDLPQRSGDRHPSQDLPLLGRLQHLQEMGLAQPLSAGRWRLHRDAEQTLRGLGERGDIVRTMQRAFSGQQREFAVFNAHGSMTAVVGRIAGKGIADELRDRAYLLVDGLDGRAHYVPLPFGADFNALPTGGIVEVRSPGDRAADRNVAALAEKGIYRTQRHLTQLRTLDAPRHDLEEVVAGHVRRLEALRRAGIVERLDEGIWRVPSDIVERARAYDRGRLGDAVIELRSHLSIERQIHAIGATWLDQQLLDGKAAPGAGAFAGAVFQACEARRAFLVEQGYAQPQGQRIILARNLLETLRIQELSEAAARVAAKTGLTYRPLQENGRVSGVYRRSLVLVSGRFAMLDDGIGFTLVPWKPVIEKRLGQTISAVVRGASVSWVFGRQRGASIGAP
jgi:type IV secretory pathway VirD2 relaxase